MVNLQIPSQKETLTVNRIIGSYPTHNRNTPGPLVIALGGIHGNEPSGVFAIHNVLQELREKRYPVSGKFVGITGNIRALQQNQRFIEEDLNRMFLRRKIEALKTMIDPDPEELEMKQILQVIDMLDTENREVYFIDCHTTSANTIPYISVNNYPESIALAERYPLYKVIGLEKSIPGCCGEYLNEKGFHGFILEAGQHTSYSAIENHEAVLWLFLVHTGLLSIEHFQGYSYYHDLLVGREGGKEETYFLTEHYRIKKDERFKMKPGYINFQKVSAGEALATNEKKIIRSPCNGRILMPLYQQQGNDGFFILKDAE